MDSTNSRKVSIAAMKISFLMEHQSILPDLRELAAELYPVGVDPEKINKESPEYLLGAYEALAALITALEQKGC
jgi:hypothetical protein